MAKDPAFLFYTGDFSTGTQFFTDEQVGKYIRLLMAQHQHGHLSEQQMNHICKTYDSDVLGKFTKDAEGKFYNERLEFEINKRKKYSESRSANRLSTKTEPLINDISKTYVEHMENENKDESINITKPKKIFTPPTIEEVIHYFNFKGYKEETAKKAFEYYNEANWKDSTGKKIINWKQKMIGVWFKPENKETTAPQTSLYRKHQIE